MLGRRISWGVLFLLLAVAAVAGVGCGHNTGSQFDQPDAGSDALGFLGDGSSLFGDAAKQQLVIDPQNQTLTVTGPGTTIQFTAHFAGDTTPQQAAWTIDAAGIGTIDNTGLFTASGLLGGQTQVRAQVGMATGSTALTVVLHLIDNPGNVDPGTQTKLQGGGTADPAFAWLYPNDATVFPRGLAAPILQFAGTAPDATFVHISFSSFDYQGFFGASSPGAVNLSPQLWTTLTQSAAAKDAVKVQLTKISGGQVTGPITETWTIAQGSLKGTVYYNSYSSALVGGGVQNGAVLSIKPGGSAQLLIGGQGTYDCTVCHAVSADGSTLIAGHPTPPMSAYSTSSAYDLKNNAAQTYTSSASMNYAFGGLYPDGTVFMSLATFSPYGSAQPDWPQAPSVPGTENPPFHPAQLIQTKTGTVLSAPGWDGVVGNSMTPSFSPDGKKIAFNHFDTGAGHTLAVMDFDVMTSTFSGLTDIASDPTNFLCWPAFTPDSNWVIYQTDNRADYATWNDGLLDAKGDLYVAHLPSKTVARLDSVDGYKGTQLYLPYGTAEATLEFEPTMLPVTVGGYYWVVFTSRRDYGNTIVTTSQNDQPRKKLWVAAIDVDDQEHPSTMAHDISHPAFYLSGQEEPAGNSRGFWALDPCAQNGASCLTGDQCCSGFCRQSTGADGGPVVACVPPPTGCSQEYEKCSQSTDCCACPQGSSTQCINQYCACLSAQ